MKKNKRPLPEGAAQNIILLKETVPILVFSFNLHHMIGPYSTSFIFLLLLVCLGFGVIPSVLLESMKEGNHNWNYEYGPWFVAYLKQMVSRNKQLIYSLAKV